MHPRLHLILSHFVIVGLMLADRFFEAKKLIRHFVFASGPHGVHSPLVYELITQVLSRKNFNPDFDLIENERKKLLSDNSVLSVLDFGAGSRISDDEQRKVSSIAASAMQSAHCAQALFKLVRHFLPSRSLELGTSLGITASYLAKANSNGHLWTLEGSPVIADRAQSVFDELNIDNVTCRRGRFLDTLAGTLQEMKYVDFAFIDGHHLYDPTIHYVDTILPFCSSNSIIVLDDIYWSREMMEAWDELRARKEFSLSLDFFHFGILFLTKRPEKEHFVLRLP
jgi:predicted O-methyltransferase YrrM